MSTIASPRPSISTATSNRTSLDTPVAGAAGSNAGSTRAPGSNRRNRAALRDYYNLPTNAEKNDDEESQAPQEEEGIEHAELAELDQEGFDAEKYVKNVLENEGLEGVLRVEGALVSEIKGLDGERKALVYDNYSKLIAATDTIKKMRTNMDPLTPTTSTLSPAISHIAETASSLSATLSHNPALNSPTQVQSTPKQDAQIQTVRWVLDSPRRLRHLISNDEGEKARSEWSDVRRLLDKWKTIEGADDIKSACEEAMAGLDSNASDESE